MAQKNRRRRWLCIGCGKNTSRAKEHYFVHGEVWFNEARASERGMLCIGCLEGRIGRQLTADDFPRSISTIRGDTPCRHVLRAGYVPHNRRPS